MVLADFRIYFSQIAQIFLADFRGFVRRFSLKNNFPMYFKIIAHEHSYNLSA
jgi:hypothetical protein